MNEQEIWKDIKGYEGYYQISNLGRVKSLERWVLNNGTPVKKKEIIMKQTINPSGYLTVGLRKDGKRKETFIHKIIAESFIENPKNKKEVNHIDHNKLNNSIENLEWCTRKENMNKMIIFYNKSKKPNYCIIDNCDNTTYDKNKQCLDCYKKNLMKSSKIPNKKELIDILKKHSFLSASRILKVSDNAVRKWCKKYNIPHKKEELKIYLSNLED